MNPTARRNARRYALQALYQWQLSHMPPQEIEIQFLAEHPMQNVDVPYFRELIESVPLHHAELDEHIRKFLDRTLEGLDPIELAILRLATYELALRLDIPYRVVINEALELAKRFGSEEGYKFVNGILDRIARLLRTTEARS